MRWAPNLQRHLEFIICLLNSLHVSIHSRNHDPVKTSSTSRISLLFNIHAMDLPFPTDPQEFDSDERISFSKLDNKFIAVYDDGTEFEFDADLKKWVPTEEEPLDDDLDDLREYSGTPADDDTSNKKRKQGVENGDAVSLNRFGLVMCLPAVSWHNSGEWLLSRNTDDLCLK